MKYLVLLAAAVWPAVAQAQSPAGDLGVAKIAEAAAAGGLRATALGTLIDCAWKAGQVVMQLGNEGGTGGPVTYSLAPPPGGTLSGDLVIGGTVPACAAANSCLVIGPNGVAPANCGHLEHMIVNVAPASAAAQAAPPSGEQRFAPIANPWQYGRRPYPLPSPRP